MGGPFSNMQPSSLECASESEPSKHPSTMVGFELLIRRFTVQQAIRYSLDYRISSMIPRLNDFELIHWWLRFRFLSLAEPVWQRLGCLWKPEAEENSNTRSIPLKRPSTEALHAVLTTVYRSRHWLDLDKKANGTLIREYWNCNYAWKILNIY